MLCNVKLLLCIRNNFRIKFNGHERFIYLPNDNKCRRPLNQMQILMHITYAGTKGCEKALLRSLVFKTAFYPFVLLNICESFKLRPEVCRHVLILILKQLGYDLDKSESIVFKIKAIRKYLSRCLSKISQNVFS